MFTYLWRKNQDYLWLIDGLVSYVYFYVKWNSYESWDVPLSYVATQWFYCLFSWYILSTKFRPFLLNPFRHLKELTYLLYFKRVLLCLIADMDSFISIYSGINYIILRRLNHMIYSLRSITIKRYKICIYLLTSICLYFIIIILITEVVWIRGLDAVDIWAQYINLHCGPVALPREITRHVAQGGKAGGLMWPTSSTVSVWSQHVSSRPASHSHWLGLCSSRSICSL